jgi:hypothetical protein
LAFSTGDNVVSASPSDPLRNAVERQHGGKATPIATVEVREEFQGELAFEGIVTVFALEDSPSGADRAYAWSRDLGNGQSRYFAVLHTGPIKSALDAVRAAIVAEHRAHN